MSDFFDRLLISYHYLRKVGRLPDLDRPKSFTEKVQRAKLTWRSPRMVALSDKVEAKNVVAGMLGPEWVTPTLYAGPVLPRERPWQTPYVIKCNHRSGGNFFIHSHEQDWRAIERRIARDLSRGYGRRLREWAYSQIVPQVLLEPFIGKGAPPPDYKIYVFGGEAAFTSLNWDRFAPGGLKRATFDRQWKRLPFEMNSHRGHHGVDVPPRPSSYSEMLAGAETLASGFPFARVDFYDIDGEPRFGEVTFYPQSGLFRMSPRHDLEVGQLWPEGVPS